jgi:UDP-glucose 4-epimerase
MFDFSRTCKHLKGEAEATRPKKKGELIAKNLDKKVYLLKIPFFETLLKLVKPSFHKRLYGSLEVDNTIMREKLNLKNPYSVEDGINYMINGEPL